MDGFRPGAIERALQLAATGHFRTLSEIKAVLRSERHASLDAQFAGAGIRAQLKTLIRAAIAAQAGHQRLDSRAAHSNDAS